MATRGSSTAQGVRGVWGARPGPPSWTQGDMAPRREPAHMWGRGVTRGAAGGARPPAGTGRPHVVRAIWWGRGSNC